MIVPIINKNMITHYKISLNCKK